MWSRRQGRLRPTVCGVEELRRRRREREAALRKARREQQLVSKRLLRNDAPEEAGEGCVAAILGETEVRGQGAAVPAASPAGDRGKGERGGSGQPSSRLAAP
ncbi:transmembrane and coiled-coil domains 6 [Homo sapiens]|uniref:Transmembrane and coiled-coil domains 6 n=1 Tax=Homo sapiens TaxID=9606 RepID=D6R986_HUMAN|nr:transmembrane and coiled-coil domains 6 [Homo sapiens]KAI4023014.1 transmembrane and coiled-coil domains 6 [Homo sapiens]